MMHRREGCEREKLGKAPYKVGAVQSSITNVPGFCYITLEGRVQGRCHTRVAQSSRPLLRSQGILHKVTG
jgi:hypothetical protein